MLKRGALTLGLLLAMLAAALSPSAAQNAQTVARTPLTLPIAAQLGSANGWPAYQQYGIQQSYFLQGNTSIGDNNGGFYIWSPSACGAVDGITQIAGPTGGVGPSCWKLAGTAPGSLPTVAGFRILGNPTGSSAQAIAFGVNSTLSFSSNLLGCITGTASQLGCLSPDNSTITANAGVLTAVNTGTVTSIATSSNIIGGTITATGTIAQQNILPGGRLTLQSGHPVMVASQTAQTAVYYAPYLSPWVPIYNGTTMQAYNFTASTTDTVGLTLTLGSNWAATTIYDVYVTNPSGTVELCTVAWTNATTRATALALFDGVLTNAASATCRTTNAATITLAQNQGTYLGSFVTTGSTGTVSYTFGSAASGGGAAVFGVWNYYNRVTVSTAVTDSGTSYTYTSATVRQARASAGNQVSILIGVSEDSIQASYTSEIDTTATSAASGTVAIALDSTTTIPVSRGIVWSQAAVSMIGRAIAFYSTTPAAGTHFVSANEAGDGANANTFDHNTDATLQVTLRQ